MNSRPPPPNGPPPSYAFVNRVYGRSLRPVILTIASLSALWALFSGISFFKSVGIDNRDSEPQLAKICIALGAIYMAIFVIELLGAISAIMQRLLLVRIYALASVFAALSIFASGLVRTVTHFKLKNELISECAILTNGTITFRFGLLGPISHDDLTPQEAESWCKKEWDHDSAGEIISLLITLVLGVFFAALALAYYRQTLDPTSPANAMRAPSNQVRMNAFAPPQYNAPYNTSVPNLGYAYPAQQQQYAPPPGPPPQFQGPFDDSYSVKAPGYDVGYGDAKDMDKKDPFADFEAGERDVTSRPGPGGRDTFL